MVVLLIVGQLGEKQLVNLLRKPACLGNLFMCKREYPKHIICIRIRKLKQCILTWRQSVLPNDAPRDFVPEVAFGSKVQIPVAR